MAPARSVDVTFKNDTDFALVIVPGSATLNHGIWTVSPPGRIEANATANFGSESDGVGTGTEGTVTYQLENYTTRTTLYWDNPFVGGNEYRGDVSDPTYIHIFSTGDGTGENSSMMWTLQETSSQRDGIPDDWKRNGVDMDDGTGNKIHVDLPAMGASVDKPDIFVHLDSMGGLSQISPAAIQMVVQAFRNAPHISPTGAQGINLHVDAGPNSIMNITTGATWGSLSRVHAIPEAAQYGTITSGNYDWSTLDKEKDVSGGFNRSGRKGIFHYCASVHQFGNAPNSGLSRPAAAGGGGHDFIISWMALGFPTYADINMAGTFMHELGHNLGLDHGGKDGILNKPNYISVMNYLFQLNGLTRGPTANICDFSPHPLPDLNENSLDETKGLGTDAAGLQTFRWSPAAASRVGQAGAFVAIADASQPIDWDDDGKTTNTTASFDINGDNPVSGSFNNNTTLTSNNDWTSLKLKVGAIGGGNGVAAQPVMESPAAGELTRADFDKIQPLDTTPPVTTATLNPPANAAGWNNSTVQVNFNATDDISGVISTLYSVDDDPNFTELPSGGTVTVSGQGTHVVRYYSLDRAQNQESIRSITINIDLTPPEAILSYDPYTHSIFVVGTDDLSGTYTGAIAPTSVSPSVWRAGSADIAEKRIYRITDYAGNYLDLELQVRGQENEYEINISDIRYNTTRFTLANTSERQKIWGNTIQFRRLLPGQCCGADGTIGSQGEDCGCGCGGDKSSKCLLSVLQRLTVALGTPVGLKTNGALIQANWDILHNDSNIRLRTGELGVLTSSGGKDCQGGGNGAKNRKNLDRCVRLCGLWKLKIKTVRGGLTVDSGDLVSSTAGRANVAEMRKVAGSFF